MQSLPPALAPLGAFRQFIVYRLEPKPGHPGKTLKKPINPATSRVHNAHDAAIWVGFGEAAVAVALLGGAPTHGVGFVLTRNDPFWFLDLDDCREGDGWNAVARDACARLAGAAVEVSQSCNGLHIIGSGPLLAHSCDSTALHAQFFTEDRFIALTGLGAVGSAAYAPPEAVAYFTRHFPARAATQAADPQWWSAGPAEGWRGPADDETLLERMLRSKSAGAVFGADTRATFADLWTANADVLGKAYPPDRAGDAYNASVADAALLQHLAFWTGNDAERMRRLALQSALVRDKWDQRDDYLPRSIRAACEKQTKFLQDLPPSESPFKRDADAPILTEATRIETDTFLSPAEQRDFFAGCVYVRDEHKIMLPTGVLVDSSRFNVLYGGRTFVMDNRNARTSRKAFEAFTESQVWTFPSADSTAFRPRSAPGELIGEYGRILVNTWRAQPVVRSKGNVDKFLAHLAKMVPDEKDRMYLLGYMASCVQRQGIKFQWAPLVQGTTGNGKSMLSQNVRKAIGANYCHTVRAKNIDNDFNAWMAGRTFYSVDEVYIPEKRVNVLETLKEMITASEQEVTLKGVDSSTREICGNFMFFTNHLHAMRLNRHDRRIAPFFTAQQEPGDLIRDGLTEAYFEDYVDWSKGQGDYDGRPSGYSMVAEFLWTWDIPREFDASRHPRKPKTTSQERAIEESRGSVEQNILEAIAQEDVGFRGGWMSSNYLRRLIEGTRTHINPSGYRELAESLGYITHPALPGGRVNTVVSPDAAKPRLFVSERRGDLIALTSPAAIAAAYSSAQQATH